MSYQDGYFDGYRQARYDIAEKLRELQDNIDEAITEVVDTLADKIESGEL